MTKPVTPVLPRKPQRATRPKTKQTNSKHDETWTRELLRQRTTCLPKMWLNGHCDQNRSDLFPKPVRPVSPRQTGKTARGSNPNFLAPDLLNHSTDCSETSGLAGLPPGQPLPQRNRPETLTIKRNRRNCLSRSRTRPTRKTNKSSPIQRRFGGKVTSQRGTIPSYVTPTKNPKKSSSKHHQQRALKITTKEMGKPP
jgi:hypothetical protein